MENELVKETETKSTKKFYVLGIIAFVLTIIATFIFWVPIASMFISFIAFIFAVSGTKDSRTKVLSVGTAIVAPIVLIACIISTVHFFEGSGLIGEYRKLDAEKKAQIVYAVALRAAFDTARAGETTYKGVTISEDGIHYEVSVNDLLEAKRIGINHFKRSSFRQNSDFENTGGLVVELTYNGQYDWSYTCDVIGTINGFDLIWLSPEYGFTAFKHN